MSQLSRPYQIAIGAVAVLAALWFVALRGHSGSSGGGAPSAAPPAPAPQAPAAASGHGTAPGVAGLTRAIEKARGAVAESQHSASELERKSAEASSSEAPVATTPRSAAGGSTTRASSPLSKAPASKLASTKHAAATTRHAVRPTQRVSSPAPAALRPGPPIAVPARLPAGQVLVEAVLKQGYLAAVLFVNPRAADDVLVSRELHLLLAAQRRGQPPALKGLFNLLAPELGESSAVIVEPPGREEKIAVIEAAASHVGSFGSFTRAVQVYSTPTLLLVNGRAQITAMPGLNDAFSIEQAIDEPQNG
jgi:hypothetical protein